MKTESIRAKGFVGSKPFERSSNVRCILAALAILLAVTVAACGSGGGGGGNSASPSMWTQLVGTMFTDESNAIATDANGNIFVAGYTTGGFEGVPQPSFANSDSVVFKYDAGGTRIWTRQITGFDRDSATGLATDASGNVFITGGGPSVSYLIKSDVNGNRLWTRFGVGGTVAVDASGTAYVIGSNSLGQVIVKYDGAGNPTFGTTSVYGRFIAVDASGNIYTFGGTTSGLDGNTNAGGLDAFVIKYDSASTRLWTAQFGSTRHDRAVGIAIDSGGNVYVAGDTECGLEGDTNPGCSDVFVVNNVFVAKYDNVGTRLWVRQLATSTGVGGAAAGVVTDARGNVYVAGSTQAGLDGNATAGGLDLFIVKYDDAGNKLWTRQTNWGVDVYTKGIAIDASGNIYITGKTRGALDGKPFAGSEDIFIVKYNSDGQRL